MEKEKKFTRKKLGTFCEQFDYTPLLAPSRRHKKGKRVYKNYSNKKRKYKKPYKKIKDKQTYNKPLKSPKKTNKKKKQIVCYKCGKVGHYKSNCKVKQQINELDISETLKDKLMDIFIIHSSEDEVSSSEEEEIYQLKESSFSEQSSDSELEEDEVHICNCLSKDNCICNKTINVLSKQEDIILELIDKINNPQERKDYLEKLKDTFNNQNTTITSSSTPYNFSEIIGRFKTDKQKITIQDIQQEINEIKQEIRNLKTSNLKLEVSNEQLLQEIILLKIEKNGKNLHEEKHNIEQGECSTLDETDNFINILDKINFQKWYVEVTVSINQEFSFTTIALLDTGADLNCIQEGLIPSKYFEKTRETLSQANGTKLNINYKLSNAHICNNGLCFKTTFILVKNINTKVILGNPFLALLYPFSVTEEGISTKILGQEIQFKFIFPPVPKEINSLKKISLTREINFLTKNRIRRKENQINFLKHELKYKIIREQLKDPLLTQKIDNFKIIIENEICSNLPNAF